MANDEIVEQEVEEIEELPEVEEGQEDTTDYKALALRNAGIAKRLKTKLEKSKVEVKPEAKPEVVEKPKTGMPTGVDDITSVIRQQLEERDLEQLELSDELKQEVQTYAKIQGVTVKKAMQSDYIQFKKDREDQRTKIENASLSKGRKGTTKKDYNSDNLEDAIANFDPKKLSTPEGRAEFKELKEALKHQG